MDHARCTREIESGTAIEKAAFNMRKTFYPTIGHTALKFKE
jgi:hypothetical protein